jgi:hypothetical protein
MKDVQIYSTKGNKAKLQWLHDPSKIHGNNLSNIRRETSSIPGIIEGISERQN